MRRPIPAAHVVSVVANPSRAGAALVTVRCPYCSQHHVHGEPDAGNIQYGHRAAHCTRALNTAGYIITEATE